MSSKKILGWILLIAGAGTLIWGIIARRRFYIEEELIQSDANLNAPVISIIFGIIVLIAGILCFIPRGK